MSNPAQSPKTKKQLEKYKEKLEKYIAYLQSYSESLTAVEGPTPPNGPKNPPKFP